jgi:purine-binding chemotaxis protein CheW
MARVQLSSKPTHAAGPQRSLQVVGFRLEEGEYAFDVRDVVAVERPEGLAGLSAEVPGVVGAMEFRGGLVPVVCLRTRFELGPGSLGEEARIVVAGRGREPIGFLVDSVSAVRRVSAAAFDDASDLSIPTDGAFILGVVRTDDRMILLLDSAAILEKDEAAKVRKALQALESGS